MLVPRLARTMCRAWRLRDSSGNPIRRGVSMCQPLSRVRLFVAPWTVARQAPLSVGFSREEHWSGLPCPPPGDLPDPGIEPMTPVSSAMAGGFFTTNTDRVPKRGPDSSFCPGDSSRPAPPWGLSVPDGGMRGEGPLSQGLTCRPTVDRHLLWVSGSPVPCVGWGCPALAKTTQASG